MNSSKITNPFVIYNHLVRDVIALIKHSNCCSVSRFIHSSDQACKRYFVKISQIFFVDSYSPAAPSRTNFLTSRPLTLWSLNLLSLYLSIRESCRFLFCPHGHDREKCLSCHDIVLYTVEWRKWLGTVERVQKVPLGYSERVTMTG
jgi:hypothetical protein